MPGRIWILGASDPEMTAIEHLLLDQGERVEYATVYRDGVRRRVRPSEAYASDVGIGSDLRGINLTAYAVECRPAVLYGTASDGIDWAGLVCTIDHHRPGDPGYGRPPAEYWSASSIGQVVAALDLDYWVPDGGAQYDGMPSGYAPRRARGYSDVWHHALSPQHALVAAADHCLGAAYRGECPGVHPRLLMRWRAADRAARQGRAVAEVLLDIEATTAALCAAPLLALEQPGARAVTVRDMRREPPYPELPEAACRADLGYVSGPLVGPDGRRKYTCSGSPEQVSAWLDHWAPAEGLVDLYGDPARGFAGGWRR